MIAMLLVRPQGLVRAAGAGADDAESRGRLAPFTRSARWTGVRDRSSGGSRRSRWFLLPRQAALLERDRDPRAVRRVARPDPGLRRHRVARPRGVLRHRLLRRGAVREARDAGSARGPRRRHAGGGAARSRHQRPRAARHRPHAADGDARRRVDPLRDRQPLRPITGGADGLQGVVIGPLLGRFAFGLDGRVAYIYSLSCCSCCSSSRAGSCTRRSAMR